MDFISEFNGGLRRLQFWSSPQRLSRRYMVSSRDEVVKRLNTYNGVFNCGLSVSTYIDGIPNLLYVPFDFDSDNLDKSWDDARSLYNYMIDLGYDISINYSGYRGFHCLVTCVPQFYTKQILKATQMYFKDKLRLSTSDENIMGDVARIMRIPGTLHCGKFKRVKKKGWQRQGEGDYCQLIAYNKGELIDLNDYEKYIKKFKINGFNGGTIDDDKYKGIEYPCILNHLDHYINPENNTHEPIQLMRYSFVAHKLRQGYTPEDIYNMIEKRWGEGRKYEWDDWSSEYTYGQINQISSRDDYYPLSCRSIKKLGFCLPNCPRNKDRWLKRKV